MLSSTDNNDKEYITDVTFEQITSSPYMKPYRMHFKRVSCLSYLLKFVYTFQKNQQLFWDMTLSHDSVGAIVYHKEKDALIFVRQFRPPVFIRRIRLLPENVGKSVNDIDFSKYEINLGKTIELCAGLMDKPNRSPLETIHEELIEEIGYKVPIDKIILLKEMM